VDRPAARPGLSLWVRCADCGHAERLEVGELASTTQRGRAILEWIVRVRAHERTHRPAGA
jgi:hypothetical protein